MSRLVRIPAESTSSGIIGLDEQLLGGVDRNERSQTAGDGYLERIAKYVPGEVLAFFIVINAILNQVVQTGGKGALMAGIPVMIGGADGAARVHDPGAAVRLVCARERATPG